jgi:hypothetical protein
MRNLILILLSFTLTMNAFAQYGQIKGRIYDEANNDALPFSNIFIEGTSIGAASDFDGNFIIAGVKPGIYQLTASSLGYETRITEEIQVLPGRTVSIDIPMRVSAQTLDEVVVTAEVFRRNQEAPVSLRSVGISEIENSPGANRDISKVIQTLPGVAAFPSQNRNDIIVRGGASSESKFYLDDIEIPNINHFATQGESGGTNGILNADFIREVQFYSGAFPANRGNALSGIFNFRQIDGNMEETKLRGTIGASEVSLTLDGPLGDNTTYIMSVRRSYLNFLFKLIGLPFLPTFNDAQFKVKTKIDDRSEITFIGLGSFDTNVLDRDLNNPNEFQAYLLGNIPENEQWSYAIGSVYKRFRDNGFSTMVLSRNMLNNRFYKYRDNIIDDINLLNDYSSFEAENKFRIENFIRTDNNFRITYGANMEYARYYNSTFLNIFTPFGPQIIDFDSGFDMFKYGLFGQISQSFVANTLNLTFGFRFDGNNYSESMAKPWEQFSPRFSASYLLNEKWSLNFNTGRYYQLPAYTSLGYRDSNNRLVNKENEIKYISADHLIAGVEFRPGSRSLISLEGFYKAYSNYPFSVKDSLVLAFKPVDFGAVGSEEILSIGEGHAYGFEILSQNRFKNDFSLVLSYTFAISEFKDTEGDYVSTSWDNRHIFIITGSKKFKKDWVVGLKWRYAGGLPYTPYDIEFSSQRDAWDVTGTPYFDYNFLNSMRFKPFHQLDFRVDKTWYFAKSSIRLYIDIQNFYNFKSDVQDIWTNLDQSGNPVVNPENPENYILRKLENEGSGTVVPTIGVIIDF